MNIWICYSQEDLNNLIEIVNSVYSQSKANAFSKTSAFYDLVNEKETEMTDITEKLINYRINFEIQKKFDDMYKLIEKALDSVYYSDYSIESLVGENVYNNLHRLRNTRIYPDGVTHIQPTQKEDSNLKKDVNSARENKGNNLNDSLNQSKKIQEDEIEAEKKKLGPIKEKNYTKMGNSNSQVKVNFEDPNDSPNRLIKKKSFGTKFPKENKTQDNQNEPETQDLQVNNKSQGIKDIEDLLDNQEMEPPQVKNGVIDKSIEIPQEENSPEMDIQLKESFNQEEDKNLT